MAYASVADLRRWMQPDVEAGDSSINDTLAEQCLEASASQIDAYCHRTFGAATGDFDFAPLSRRGRLDCGAPNGGFTAITAVQVREADVSSPLVGGPPAWADLDAADWEEVGPKNRAGETVFLVRTDGYPWPASWEGLPSVRITGTAGSDTYPDAISTANLMQAAKIYERYRSPLGPAVIDRPEAEFTFVPRALDIDVKALIDPYVALSQAFG